MRNERWKKWRHQYGGNQKAEGGNCRDQAEGSCDPYGDGSISISQL